MEYRQRWIRVGFEYVVASVAIPYLCRLQVRFRRSAKESELKERLGGRGAREYEDLPADVQEAYHDGDDPGCSRVGRGQCLVAVLRLFASTRLVAWVL